MSDDQKGKAEGAAPAADAARGRTAAGVKVLRATARSWRWSSSSPAPSSSSGGGGDDGDDEAAGGGGVGRDRRPRRSSSGRGR